MRQRSAAIILRENNILMIHRRKAGKEYFVLPGGGVDPGETPEIAVIRELQEETSLDGTIEQALPKFNDETGDEHFNFICSAVGEPQFAPDSPEAKRNSPENFYEFEWIEKSRIADLTIFPTGTKDQLLEL
jgi:8-oxo-dGTP diphosphatase